MMNIFEFMKAIQIEGADTVVTHHGDSVRVSWDFAAPGHPTLTHRRVSRTIQKQTLSHLHLLVDDVKHIIEVSRNAQ